MVACYMKTSCSNRWQPLKVGSTVAITSDDVCSLFPDKSWFKISSSDSSVMEESKDVNGKRKTVNPSQEEPPNKKLRTQDSIETIYLLNRSVLDDWDTEPVHENDDNCTSNSTNDILDNPSAQHSSSATKNPSVEVISAGDKTKNIVVDFRTGVSRSPTEVTATVSTGTANTNETSSCNQDEAEKKIKWDCGRHFSDQADQQTSETAEDPSEAAAPVEENSVATAEGPASANEPPRNKCAYGSQCYRTSSEHRTRYSHPGDADYDVADSRPECPYGIRCYRKNPQHKRDFKHTKNRRSRAQTPVRVRAPDDASGTEQSSAEESVDESEYEPSLYDDTSDDCISEFDDKSDFEGVSDCDNQ